MINLSPFGLVEIIGFVVILFLLMVLDALVTNIVARAAGREYYRVESLPWVKWLYFKFRMQPRGGAFSLFSHLGVNFLIMILIFLLPVKGGYVLFFDGLFFLRVWYMTYKAYVYARGYL